MAEPRTRRRKAVEQPYPGLRPFLRRENLIFFGREGQTDALIERLRQNHFLAVLGSSGSGKSSLVRAGLLPALESGLMAGARSHWKMAVIRPGERPIAYLANALAELVANPDDPGYKVIPAPMMLQTMLMSSSFGLKEAALGPILRENENLLVVVDQFEEIFRFNEDSKDVERLNEAKAFIRLLLEASSDPALPVYVVITMRSDFLGECPRFRDLPEAINAGQYLVPRLTRAQMRDAIAGPVAVFQEEIAPDLVIRLLNDIGDNPDQLPILQHALMRTWDHHTVGEELTISDYEAIGGLQNALNQHAEEIYANLSAQGLGDVTEALFKSLTETETEGKGIRRPSRMSEVCATAGVSQEKVVQVVEAFRAPGCSFLMPPVDVPLAADTILDISHESFMRLWARLGDWVREEYRSAEEYHRLSKAAADHHAGKVNLWRQPELGIALKWREARKPTAAWASRYDNNFAAAMTFLDDSLAAWKKEEEDKAAMVLVERKSEERKKTVRRLSFLIIVMGSMLALTIYLLFYSWERRREALEAERREKEKTVQVEKQRDTLETQIRVIRLLKQASDAKADSIKEYQWQLEDKLKSEQSNSRKISSLLDATKAQKDSIQWQEGRLQKFNAELKMKGAELERIAQAQRDSTELAKELRRRAEVRSAQFEALQLAARSGETPVRETGALLALKAFYLFTVNEGDPDDPQIYTALHSALERYAPLIRKQLPTVPYAFDYDPLEDRANAVNISGKLYQFFVENGGARFEEKNTANVHDNRFIGHGKDHSTILVSSPDHRLFVYKGLGCYLSRNLAGHSAGITSALEIPQSGEIWSADLTGKVLVWPQAEGNAVGKPFPTTFAGGVSAMALHPNGTKVAIASPYAITLADPNRKAVLKTVKIPGNPTAMAFSKDGTVLAFGLETGRVGYYNIATGFTDTLRVHSAKVSAICFSPDGRYMASCSYDQTVRLWRIARLNEPPVVLKGHTSWVMGIGFRRDSKFLYSVSRDKTMRYWYTQSEAIVKALEAAVGRTEFDDQELKQYNQLERDVSGGNRK